MKKSLISLTSITLLAFSLAACTADNKRVGTGAALGGATGLIVGSALGGKAGGAIAGGVIGATAGAIIADATNENKSSARSNSYRECVRVRYDRDGEPYCARYRRVYEE